ncbi:MAG: tetratricopeptide repeat protein, partial [Bryobacteraceae bacterium]
SFFSRGDFAEAWPLFEKAARGPLSHVAAAARSRARICEWKCAALEEDGPQSAEDHYHFGLAFLNQRRHEEAERHFRRALELAPESDYVLYALALSRGLRGDIESGAESLRRAVELNPANRVQARKDPDFQELLRYPAIADILYPERGKKF